MTKTQIQKLLDLALQSADDDLERDCNAALAGDHAAANRLAVVQATRNAIRANVRAIKALERSQRADRKLATLKAIVGAK